MVEGAGGVRWTVSRQDDNGNRFLVSEHESEEEARSIARELEARGHKQTYSVERVADGASGVDDRPS
jgi:hypothetical protein